MVFICTVVAKSRDLVPVQDMYMYIDVVDGQRGTCTENTVLTGPTLETLTMLSQGRTDKGTRTKTTDRANTGENSMGRGPSRTYSHYDGGRSVSPKGLVLVDVLVHLLTWRTRGGGTRG